MTTRTLVVLGLSLSTLSCGSSDAGEPVLDDTGSGDVADATPDTIADTPPACSGTVCAGACVVGSCDFAVTSISAVVAGGGAQDWVSGGAFFSVRGQGFAKGMKLFLGDGRAPLRVIDATTATIQAPPGPQGSVDVRIELAGKKSSTKGAFAYRTGPIEGDLPWEKRTMAIPHADMPSVAVLHDGRALVSGGLSVIAPITMTDRADLFSLDSKDTVPAAGPMNTARWNHSTVTLLDGRAALIGASGVGASPCCNSLIVDLFDPKTNTFVKAKSAPTEAFQGPRAALLPDGRVLVLAYGSKSAHVFDPETETFTTVAGAPTIDYWQTGPGLQYLTRLRDGRVLIVTGLGQDAYAFDGDTSTFTKLGKGPKAGVDALLTLPDGRAIALGGVLSSGAISKASDVVELFDPATGAFTPASYKLSAPRMASASALSRDGSVLVVGGATGEFPNPYGCGSTAPAEKATAAVDRVDPVAGTVSTFAALPEPNDYLVTATLVDGSVLVAGGGVCGASKPYPYLYFRKAPPLPK